jgi:DNA polymerase-4
MSRVVDRINQKYGNNSIYFGAMQQALAQDAAPMRIPFSHIPETAQEQDVASHPKGGARKPGLAEDLFLQRERQFKVLAENAHREAQKRKRPSASSGKAEPFKAGAGGWNQASKRDNEPAIGETRPLF